MVIRCRVLFVVREIMHRPGSRRSCSSAEANVYKRKGMGERGNRGTGGKIRALQVVELSVRERVCVCCYVRVGYLYDVLLALPSICYKVLLFIRESAIAEV